jgi:hypothetical protein
VPGPARREFHEIDAEDYRVNSARQVNKVQRVRKMLAGRDFLTPPEKVFPLNGIYLLTLAGQNGRMLAAVTLVPAA